jgi:two-component system, chemotaxis family, chemotaxis protein CheY
MKYKGTILVADDELHIRKFVGMILKQLGIKTILEAGNGEEAVAMFQSEKPKVVLLDVDRPFMNGLEALKKIKEIDAGCVAIMLTSLTTVETVEEALSLGAAGYIIKDASREEIASDLTEAIDACLESNNDESTKTS